MQKLQYEIKKKKKNDKVHTIIFLAVVGSFSGFSSRLEKLLRNKIKSKNDFSEVQSRLNFRNSESFRSFSSTRKAFIEKIYKTIKHCKSNLHYLKFVKNQKKKKNKSL